MTTTSSAETRPPRLPAIDGLRTLAIAAVFVEHSSVNVANGGLGVDIFFVISGFVITSLLLTGLHSTSGLKLVPFYRRRLVRLWPALVAVCLFCAMVAAVKPPRNTTHEVPKTLVSLFYGMDFARASAPLGDSYSALLGHTWSLAVEEQFYLVWPLALLLLVRLRQPRTIMLAVAGLLLVPMIARTLFWNGEAASYNRFYNAPDTRADQLLAGCLLACLVYFGGPVMRRAIGRWANLLIWPAGALLLGIVSHHVPGLDRVYRSDHFYLTAGLLVVALLAAVIVACFALCPENPLTRLFATPALSWPGRYLSYGFYLWHYPMCRIVATQTSSPLRWIPELVLTVVACVLSWKFIETPASRWAARRFEQRAVDPALSSVR